MTTLCSKGCGRRAQRRGMCSSHYNTRRERDIAYGRWQSGYVDAEPARQHVLRLRAAGMGRRRLAELCGVSDSVIHVLVKGRPERGTGPSRRIACGNARAILAVPLPDAPHRGVAARARVPAVGTTRRLQALVAFGWSQSELCSRLGILVTNSTGLFNGTRTSVTAATARRVEALFAELQLTPGHNDRARIRARRRGWALPMQWDEDTIDDPAARPDGVRRGSGRRRLDADEYADLRGLGFSDAQIAARFGIQVESLQRFLDRHGIGVAS